MTASNSIFTRQPRVGAKPPRWQRLLLGLIPGARVMARFSFSLGLPYLILGAGAVLGTIWASLTWHSTRADLARFEISARWFLLHAAALYASVLIYELLRFAASLEERSRADRMPRFLCALVVPSAVVVATAPSIIDLWAPFIEALWFMAVTVGLGSLPASVWVIWENRWVAPSQQRAFVKWSMIVGASGLIAAALVGILSRNAVAHWAAAQGFRVLPKILGG